MTARGPIALRPPELVMQLNRMGAFHPTRLSFLRVLLRRMKRDAWRFDRPVFEIAADGTGCAVYGAHGPARSYSLVCFAHDLPDEARSDRVIATRWDATFALFDGVPSPDDLARLHRNVPLQEAGRVTASELTLSRANRSVRLWDHVVGALADGRQPDQARLAEVGYLMRTTAVYGSGKFGAADRLGIADRAEMAAPFQAEMLTVWLIRTFVTDLVEAMAAHRSPKAARLAPDLRRSLGIGNSTGLGMAPFLMNHPVLLNNWMSAREAALARVRSQEKATPAVAAAFADAVAMARDNAMAWRSAHPVQMRKLADLRADLDKVAGFDLPDSRPWDAIWRWGEAALSFEGQEALLSLLMEPHGDLVDDLIEGMSADEEAAFAINGRMDLARLKGILDAAYASAEGPAARIWYISADKLEPRLGAAGPDLAPYAQPWAPLRDAMALRRDLEGRSGRVSEFLLDHPEHRHAVRRAQIVDRYPYAEIRGDTASADLLPIDMLRAKLSFFGASRFDPRSDRWVRINLFQGAPYPEDLAMGSAEEWAGGVP
ncbi:MAG: hypothetical protein AAGE03_05905 [Pseudomonadota bacterium]